MSDRIIALDFQFNMIRACLVSSPRAGVEVETAVSLPLQDGGNLEVSLGDILNRFPPKLPVIAICPDLWQRTIRFDEPLPHRESARMEALAEGLPPMPFPIDRVLARKLSGGEHFICDHELLTRVAATIEKSGRIMPGFISSVEASSCLLKNFSGASRASTLHLDMNPPLIRLAAYHDNSLLANRTALMSTDVLQAELCAFIKSVQSDCASWHADALLVTGADSDAIPNQLLVAIGAGKVSSILPNIHPAHSGYEFCIGAVLAYLSSRRKYLIHSRDRSVRHHQIVNSRSLLNLTLIVLLTGSVAANYAIKAHHAAQSGKIAALAGNLSRSDDYKSLIALKAPLDNLIAPGQSFSRLASRIGEFAAKNSLQTASIDYDPGSMTISGDASDISNVSAFLADLRLILPPYVSAKIINTDRKEHGRTGFELLISGDKSK